MDFRNNDPMDRRNLMRGAALLSAGAMIMRPLPSFAAEGPMAASAAGVSRAMVVRFRKSITDSPDENRAERAVGKTWFGPLT